MTKSDTTASGYTVTYANGAITSVTLPSAVTTTNTIKYTANGWTTGSSNTNDPDYANGASFGSNSTTNLVLYPNFTTSTTKGSVTLPTLTKVGFTFKGWNTKADGSGTNYAAAASYTPSANITLYAIWDYIGVVRMGSNKYLPYAYIDGVWKRVMPYIYDTTNKVWEETGAND